MAATKKSAWYAKFGITGRDARRLERALGALADNQGAVESALTATGEPRYGAHAVCAAIRYILDGWEK